ncbi:hypothetical protein IIE_05252 [Bacillus cereus VD045]|nr:hypothetical protein IIE_05252 [Bacillus cereus VD045]
MSQSSSFRIAYEARENGLQEGIEKGKELGIQEGKLAEKAHLIRGMPKQGVNVEDITKFTNKNVTDIRYILLSIKLNL